MSHRQCYAKREIIYDENVRLKAAIAKSVELAEAKKKSGQAAHDESIEWQDRAEAAEAKLAAAEAEKAAMVDALKACQYPFRFFDGTHVHGQGPKSEGYCTFCTAQKGLDAITAKEPADKPTCQDCTGPGCPVCYENREARPEGGTNV